MESDVAQLPLSDKLWAWYQTYQKQIIGGTAIVLVVGLIVWFVVWQQNEKAAAAGEALSRVAIAQMGSEGTDGAAEAYQKVVAEYPNTQAGIRAQLLAAGSLFTAGKYAEAQSQFQKFTREHRDSALLGEALLGVAACLDAQGKTNEAVEAYKNLVERHPGENVIPQAKFALARLYEAQNKPELAHTLFEDVARNNPYGSLGSEAGMRAEELKQKHPNLAAPATPVPTNAAPKLEKK